MVSFVGFAQQKTEPGDLTRKEVVPDNEFNLWGGVMGRGREAPNHMEKGDEACQVGLGKRVLSGLIKILFSKYTLFDGWMLFG